MHKAVIQQIIANLRKSYTGDRTKLDFEVTQVLQGNQNRDIRQRIIKQVAPSENIPAVECTVLKVSEVLKNYFDQLQLFSFFDEAQERFGDTLKKLGDE